MNPNKTETKTSTENASQNTTSQNARSERTQTAGEMPNPFAAFAAFDPMGFWAQTQTFQKTFWAQSQQTMQQTFQKAFEEAYGRAQTYADQYAAMESQFVARAQGAVGSWAQLAQDAIAYGAQLSAEARKVGFDAARKMSVGA